MSGDESSDDSQTNHRVRKRETGQGKESDEQNDPAVGLHKDK